MKLNIRREIEKLSKKTNLFSVISEAVVNSIQAESEKIDIIFHARIQEGILSSDNDEYLVDKLEIIDDGVGFNEENIDSFCTYRSDAKKELGCKGVGRLCFLKIFENVNIESTTEKNKIKFKFDEEFNENYINSEIIEPHLERKTIITFQNIIKKTTYENIRSYSNRLYDHILPLLYFRREKKDIEINFIFNDKNEYNSTIKTSDIPNFEQEKFVIEENITGNEIKTEFILHYSFLGEQKKGTLNSHYCANNRAVYGFEDNDLKINPINKIKTIFLLTSSFLDEKVNDERNDFDIYPKKLDLIHYLSWEIINSSLKNSIKKVLYQNYPTLEETNKDSMKKIKENHLHLIDYIEGVDSLGGLINSEDIIKEAEDKFLKDKRKFRLDLKNKDDNSKDIIKKASDLAGKELIEYVLTRDKIIEKLEEYSSNKERIEENIRNLFLKRGESGSDYSPISLKENNLWLLDDKFMSYNYAASEKAINTMLKSVELEIADTDDKFDIGMYSNTNSNEAKKIILLEMKKFSANYKENSTGIDQLGEYAYHLKESKVDEIYLYLIAKIDDKFRRKLIRDGYNRVFSHDGEIYQGFFDDTKAYIQVISPESIISDAKARNKTFIDVLKNKVEY